MGKIFSISGNFADGKQWRKDAPHYEGSMIVTPSNEIFGLADLQTKDNEQARFLYGKIVPSQKNEEFLMLLILSAQDPENALFISILDAGRNEIGQWAPVVLNEENNYIYCDCHGLASFDRKSEEYSWREYRRIQYSYFYRLSQSHNDYNQRLIGAMKAFGQAYITDEEPDK